MGDRAIARNRAGELTVGVIDLLFKSQKGWEVRDYKTDVSLDVHAYEGQLQAYRNALDQVGHHVVNAELVHGRSSDE